MSDLKVGKLKWFDRHKGFGFIVPDDGSADVLVLNGTLQNGGFVTIRPDQKLRYTVAPNVRKRGAFLATAVQPA